MRLGMKSKIGVVLLAISLLQSTIVLIAPQASAWDHSTQPRDYTSHWLFMVYQAGDNDLEWYLMDDMDEMEAVGDTHEVSIVALMDRWDGVSSDSESGRRRYLDEPPEQPGDEKDDRTNGNWTETRRFEILYDNIRRNGSNDFINSRWDSLGEKNVGDPNTLVSFVSWATSYYPAQRYCLVIANHGGGESAIDGSCWDWESDPTDHKERITPLELHNAMEQIKNNGINIDVLVFDSCLQANLENYYEIKDFLSATGRICGSEEIIPWDGIPYHSWFGGDIVGNLISVPGMDAALFSVYIVDEYQIRYQNTVNDYATFSSVKVNLLTNLATAVDNLAQELMRADSTYHNEINQARSWADYCWGDVQDPVYWLLDLYDLAYCLRIKVPDQDVKDAAQSVMDNVNSCINREWHTSAHNTFHGLTIYFPDTYNRYMKYYEYYRTELHMSMELRWDNFLKVFWTSRDTTPPNIIVNQDTYGWYNSDPGKVIDVDFDSGGNNETHTLLDYAQYKIGETGTWRDIFTSNVQTYTDNWQISWSSCPEGENTIYIRCFDFAGNEATDSIVFKKDTTVNPPTVSSSTHPDQDKWYSNNDPVFNWIPPSDLSEIQGYYYIFNQNSNTIPTPSTGTWTTSTSETFDDVEDGVWHFHIVSKDNAGNVGTTANHSRVLIDVTPPTDSYIYINNDTEYTNSTTVTLNVSSSDTHSEVNQMRFSNGDFHNAQYYLDSPGSWGDDQPEVINSPHDYPDGYYNTWEIYDEGASSMRVHFIKIDTTETGAPPGPLEEPPPFWCKDVLYVKNQWQTQDEYVIKYENYYGEDIWSPKVAGDRIILVMKCYDGGADPWDNGWGFETDKYQISEDHMYPNDYDYTWIKTHSGALKMKVRFDWINTQTGHDFIYIYDKDNNQIAHYTGSHTNIWTPIAYGDTIKIRLKTDSSVKDQGFFINQYSYYSHGTWSTWEVYQTTKVWVLPEGDGEKGVYFQTKDAAGNIAGYVYDTIILDTGPPVAVDLYNPTSITSSSMVLEWTENEDSDFQRYELHNSTVPGFTLSSSTLYKKSTDVKWLKQKVTGLSSSTTYYFKVRVYDMANGFTDSNEVSGTTKSSGGGGGGCPFVFIWNGIAYALENNILPGSEDFGRDERDIVDYYKIEQGMVPKNGVYSFIIGEFEREYTNLNQLELMVIDHTDDVYVAITKDGVIFTYRNPIEPVSAMDRCGNDYLATVNSTGGDYYEGYEGDYLIIDFGNPNTTNGAKLVLRTDMKPPYNLHSRLDPEIDTYSIKIQILNKTQLWKDVYVIEPRDKWAIDAIDLSPFLDEMNNESFKVRLYWTNHHKVDYIGLDTSQQVNVSVQTHSIISAFHISSGDVTDKLLYDDENYTKIMPSDYITVMFPYTIENNETRDVILVSKGYYYTPINDIDISQDVKVTLSVDGTVGNTVEMIILESISDGYSYVPIVKINITVGVSGNSVNTTFKGYATMSYEILLRYIANGTGINPVNIELEYNDIVKIKNLTFNASEGIVQEKYINIDNDLNETLYESNGQVFTKVGVLLNMEPSNLMRENDVFDWENIVWDFGDGTNLTTTNRTVTHEYEAPGIYTTTVKVTYDDGTIVTKTNEIWVS